MSIAQLVLESADGTLRVLSGYRYAEPHAGAKRFAAGRSTGELPPKVDLRRWMTAVEASFRIEDVALVRTDLDVWRGALAEGHPIIFGINLYYSFYNHRRPGLVPMPTRREAQLEQHGGHAMLCVGYSDADRVFILQPVLDSLGSSVSPEKLLRKAQELYDGDDAEDLIGETVQLFAEHVPADVLASLLGQLRQVVEAGDGEDGDETEVLDAVVVAWQVEEYESDTEYEDAGRR